VAQSVYSYDHASRLTGLAHTTDSGVTLLAGYTWSYDPAGRLYTTIGPDPDGAGPAAAAKTVNTFDMLGRSIQTDVRTADNSNTLLARTENVYSGPGHPDTGQLWKSIQDDIVAGSGELAGFDYQKEITIDHTHVAEDLHDFPLLVTFTNDVTIGAHTLTSGYDIRFSDDSGEELPYQRESFGITDGAASGVFWVKVPTIYHDQDTIIHMYYGNPNAVDEQDASGVWGDTNYLGVWHLDDVTYSCADSSGNGNTGQSIGVAAAAGVIGGGAEFGGDGDRISVASSAVSPDAFTISAWVEATEKIWSIFASWGNYTDPGVYLRWSDGGQPIINFAYNANFQYFSSSAWDTLKGGYWHYVSFTVPGNGEDAVCGSQMFVDGVCIAQSWGVHTPGQATKTSFNIGATNYGYYAFQGLMDEVRLSDSVRSAAWINFEYYNMHEEDHDLTLADGLSTSSAYTYTPDGAVASQTVFNPDTGDQQTTYVYGTTLADSGVARSDLLRAVIYPDSDDTFTMSGPVPTLSDGYDQTYDRVEYTYNRQGEQTQLKDQNQTVHDYIFDGLGRLTDDCVTAWGDDIDQTIKRISRAYEVRGMIQRVTSYDNATPGQGTAYNDVFYTYNDFGQLTRDYQRHIIYEIQLDQYGIPSDGTPYVEYTYAGPEHGLRLESVRYPNGRLVHYTYGEEDSTADVLNRLDAICDDSTQYPGTPGEMLAAYSYLGLGTIVAEDYQTPGVKLDYVGTGNYSGLDQWGRVVDQVWQQYGDSPQTLDEYRYGYDAAGNRLWKENVVANGATQHFDETYAYDEVYRLIGMERGLMEPEDLPNFQSSPDFTQDWGLDATGNFSTFDDDGTSQTRTSNAANEIDGISGAAGWATPVYDAAGNMTTVPVPLSGDADHFVTCTYDAWNRLIEVKDMMGEVEVAVGQYGYDGLGRRGLKAFDTGTPGDPSEDLDYYHIYYAGQQVVETRYTATSADPATLKPKYQFVWSPRYIDALICRDENKDLTNSNSCTDTTDQRLYYLSDANYNVTALVGKVSGNWEVVERYVYAPYGKVTFLDGDWAPTVVSGQADGTASAYSNTVLYCGYWLDAETGNYHVRARDLVTSMSVWAGRDPKEIDPNLYRYCRNRPLNFVDPFGLADIQVNYYDVPGQYELLAWRMSRLGPGGHFGSALAGYYRRGNITTTKRLVSDAKCPANCPGCDATVTAKIQFFVSDFTITLPRWRWYDSPSSMVTPEQRQAWDEMIAAMKIHENRHIDIYKRFNGEETFSATVHACGCEWAEGMAKTFVCRHP